MYFPHRCYFRHLIKKIISPQSCAIIFITISMISIHNLKLQLPLDQCWVVSEYNIVSFYFHHLSPLSDTFDKNGHITACYLLPILHYLYIIIHNLIFCVNDQHATVYQLPIL